MHTGDQVLKFNSSRINSVADLTGPLEPLHAGDTFRIEVMHEGSVREAPITIPAREFTAVRIRQLPDATARQRFVVEKWGQGE